MIGFTKRKFLSFPLEKQHKKCAEILRSIYDKMLVNAVFDKCIDDYQILQTWMGLNGLIKKDFKEIADKHQQHLTAAKISVREHHLLPKIRKGDKAAGEPSWPIAVYLDQLRSAHNVGSIIRTIEAFSLGKLYFSPDTPFIDHKQIQNTSMGAFKWVDCQKIDNLDILPKPLIVLETSDEALSIFDFPFPDSFTLVIGNEEYGCSDKTLKQADILIEIPLRGRKNSLNVANAFAIAAGEISRQKMQIKV